MMKLLLEAKSPLNATDMDGMTALHHGRLFIHSVDVYLVRCADKTASYIRRPRRRGTTALASGR